MAAGGAGVDPCDVDLHDVGVGDRPDRRFQLPNTDRRREVVGGPRREDGERRAGAQETVGRQPDRAVASQHRDHLRALVGGLPSTPLEVLARRADTDLMVDARSLKLVPDLPDPSAGLPAPRRRIGEHDDRCGDAHPQPPERPVPALGEPPAESCDSLSVLAYLFHPDCSNVAAETEMAWP